MTLSHLPTDVNDVTEFLAELNAQTVPVMLLSLENAVVAEQVYFVNQAFSEQFGLCCETLCPDADPWQNLWTNAPQNTPLQLVCGDSQSRWFLLSSRELMLDGGFYRLLAFDVLDSMEKMQRSIALLTEALAASQAQLALSEKRLDDTQHLARVGTWELDLRTMQIEWSASLYEIYREDPQHFTPSYENFLAHAAPDEIPAIKAKLQEAIRTGKPQRMTHTHIRSDGSTAIVEVSGHVIYDAAGQPVKMVGSSMDVTHLVELKQRNEELAILLEKSHQEVYIFDYNTLNYLYANQSALDNLGYSLEELKQLTVYDTNPFLTPDIVTHLKSLESTQQTVSNVSVHQRKDGSTYPVKASLQHVRFQGHDAVVLFDTDITELKRTETELLHQNQLLENILSSVPVRIFWKDYLGRYLGANELFLQDAGITDRAELIGKTDYDMPWGETEGDHYYYGDMKIVHSAETRLHNEDVSMDDEGNMRVWLTSRVPLKDGDGNTIGMLGSYEDITSIREMEHKLKEQAEILHHQAHHDALTQLPNRVLLQDRIEHAIEQARLKNTQFALFFVDLDQFKKINDSLGHDVGDQVLQQVANNLKAITTEGDTLARLGGDEFTIVQESLKHPHEATDLAQKIIEATRQPIKVGEHVFFLSGSVGISLYPKDANTYEALLKCADAAMYRAKDEGRNNFQFYTDDMTLMAFEHIAMQTSLRLAISHQEFVVYYQPQVDAKQDKLVGLEALVRWQHPQMGIVSPAKFIPIAEEIGLIVELDRLVMQQAMRQLYQWRGEGLFDGILSLNLAVKQLQQTDFIDHLQALLQATGCDPHWLEFEITESDIMKNLDEMTAKLQQIRDLGIRVAVDDFGTGYSSLAYLKRLPVSKLKIDQSFVRDLPHDDEDAVITKTIIAMAENLGLRVIAEGVETPEQRAFLVENHCEQLQGYLYSPPLSAEHMGRYLRNLL
ncbi:sensor domain-containing protein [Thiomicrorhabdus cannonii]|uniref:sensor domain-containing protein n=1 Tax=Thiomicrorhabdus cannonii TaxID=2748011 RepID=UPI0015BF8595|nr:EAL domain-containing protein [Thiomicrorhabdus cannonii]